MGDSKFAGFRGDFLICGGLNFPGGLGFRRRKSPLLALDSTNFQKFSPEAGRAILTYLNSEFFLKFTCSRLSQFSENNMVNTVK